MKTYFLLLTFIVTTSCPLLAQQEASSSSLLLPAMMFIPGFFPELIGIEEFSAACSNAYSMLIPESTAASNTLEVLSNTISGLARTMEPTAPYDADLSPESFNIVKKTTEQVNSEANTAIRSSSRSRIAANNLSSKVQEAYSNLVSKNPLCQKIANSLEVEEVKRSELHQALLNYQQKIDQEIYTAYLSSSEKHLLLTKNRETVIYLRTLLNNNKLNEFKEQLVALQRPNMLESNLFQQAQELQQAITVQQLNPQLTQSLIQVRNTRNYYLQQANSCHQLANTMEAAAQKAIPLEEKAITGIKSEKPYALKTQAADRQKFRQDIREVQYLMNNRPH